MMEDVKKGRIRCIVVKDLSRLGRDYLESGYYIERVFPFFDLRFISINDEFDSSHVSGEESLSVPLRNMMNAMYAKDISQKICSTFETRKRQGKPLNGAVPYGYFRDEGGHMQIAEAAGDCVQTIFAWKLLGVPHRQIAQRLNALRIPTPNEKRTDAEAGNEAAGPGGWYPSTVLVILKNQAYTGDLLVRKTSQALFAGKQKIRLPKQEWTIVENEHPALIARDDFEAVQELLCENAKIQNRTRDAKEVSRKKWSDLFAGMLYCGECKKKLSYDRRGAGKGEEYSYAVYHCRNNTRGLGCAFQPNPENLLKVLVTDQMRLQIQSICKRGELLKSLQENREHSMMNILNRKISSLGSRKKQYFEKRQKLYEDYVEGVLTGEEYFIIKHKYESECRELDTQLEAAEEEKANWWGR